MIDDRYYVHGCLWGCIRCVCRSQLVIVEENWSESQSASWDITTLFIKGHSCLVHEEAFLLCFYILAVRISAQCITCIREHTHTNTRMHTQIHTPHCNSVVTQHKPTHPSSLPRYCSTLVDTKQPYRVHTRTIFQHNRPPCSVSLFLPPLSCLSPLSLSPLLSSLPSPFPLPSIATGACTTPLSLLHYFPSLSHYFPPLSHYFPPSLPLLFPLPHYFFAPPPQPVKNLANVLAVLASPCCCVACCG